MTINTARNDSAHPDLALILALLVSFHVVQHNLQVFTASGLCIESLPRRVAGTASELRALEISNVVGALVRSTLKPAIGPADLS